jgi:DNA end-binding protein Ku
MPEMAPSRPLWSGHIALGLIEVPVRLYAARESKEHRFHFVDRRDLMPVADDGLRRDTGERVPPDQIVRAFEIEAGRYVPIAPDDLDRLDVELTQAIDIVEFVPREEVDPIAFREAYYALPQEGGEKPYRLLGRALEETGRVGLARIVIRDKQHLACLRPYRDVLVLEAMVEPDEVRNPAALEGEPSWRNVELRREEIELAISLVESGAAADTVDLMRALRDSVAS